MKIYFPTFVALLFLTSTPQLSAENWPNWRGPNQDGSSNETNLPEKFSKTENVKWKVTLPGAGSSTPVIWEDHVFLTSANGETNSVGLALDRKTGKELWRKEFTGVGKDKRSNFAAPSAVTDGKTVTFFFGNGQIGVYDFAGNELWSGDIADRVGGFAFGWTFSSSPVLYGDKLYLQILQRDEPVEGRGLENAESFIMALDVKTGEEVFRQLRPSNALMESREAFTSPIIANVDGRNELVVIGGDCITGHDLDNDCKELWRWGTWNPDREKWWRVVPSPVYGEGIFLACAPKKNPIFAVKAGLNGDLADSALAWVSEVSKEQPITSDVSTPLYYQGRFYVLSSDAKALVCLDPKTGKVIYSEQIAPSSINRQKLEASPTAGDGKIYLLNQLGDVFVVAAGDEYKLLHHAEMGETLSNITRSSIAISQGNLFIRTDTDLFCIGK